MTAGLKGGEQRPSVEGGIHGQFKDERILKAVSDESESDVIDKSNPKVGLVPP